MEEDGNRKITPIAISHVFVECYSKLYNLKTTSNAHSASIDKIDRYLRLANLPQINQTQAAELLKPIELQEVLKVIAGLSGGKVTGLTNAYYKLYAMELAPHLLKVYHSASELGKL
ncbi:Hypothetical predicted protein [Pelobates cultripes]|uniref:Uncharacterized protein n=1 Tax=Pelobates cultripes TaxID=61616 RepID=A0AAD1R073_PELCU|nr:Hypothetical predicted protein [Pelobates cultripes]